MPRVSVLATGGTIASMTNAQGASVASRGVQDLLMNISDPHVEIRSRDILRLGSFQMDHGSLRTICEEVHSELANPDVDGVVITHGTDTMEETAYLLDLIHASPKPVVLTGAQRASDAPDTDGPANLRDAISVAAAPASKNTGVLIAFGGSIYAARGTRKTHTLASEPFRTSGAGPLGHIVKGHVTFNFFPCRAAPLVVPTSSFDQTRVDIITVHPGADSALAQAAVVAGAQGVVIAGTGVGNGNNAILKWVRHAVESGTVVGLGTRVSEGPIIPIYGNGGGVDLIRAGALGLGTLPLFQARLLLALILSHGMLPRRENLDPYI